MENTKIEPFKIIGIAVKTTNQNNQAATDIVNLWDQFMKEQILDKIPNKVSNDVYSIYTEYEGDHMQPYKTILGCQVSSLENVPERMVSKSFDGGNYVKFTSEGDLTKGHVYEEWLKIWETNLNRTYTADFEIYGEKAQDPTKAEVDIFIAIH